MRSEGIFAGWHRNRAGIVLLLCVLIPQVLQAQDADVVVRGGFVSDSMKIGEQTAYYLSAHYPRNHTVLFPDSTHLFTPFEYSRKTYFPTNTTAGISADSTVYYLTTFEVDRVQYLRLPVYILQGRDCTMVQTARDSILITQLVSHVPDSVSVQQLPLKMNTSWQKVAFDLNTWLIAIIVVVVVVLAVVLWLLFGKRIRKYLQARRLQKNHAAFLHAYNALLGQLREAFSPPATESALAAWKKYMEQLESRPYTKLTTPETVRLIQEPSVTGDLSRIDKAIYGHSTTVVASLENLKTFADQQFKRKLKEVQHAK